jgi:hypothetical protein
VGVNSVSSSPSDPNSGGTDYFLNDGTGLLTVSVYYATNTPGLLAEATTINTDDKSASTLQAGLSLLNTEFTQESFGTSLGSEAATQSIQFDYGDLDVAQQADYDIGTAANITSGSSGLYAILVTYAGGYEGYLVLNGGGAAYNVGGGSSPAASMYNNWASNQNLLLAVPTASPEPTTLALAGLGGISMLFMRRRKV